MSKHEISRAKVNRPITPAEIAVIRAALAISLRSSEPAELLNYKLDSLRVVDACQCGCDSVDFTRVAAGEAQILADVIGTTAEGGEVGVIIWGTSRDVTGLEIYDMGAGHDTIRLPAPESIRPWSS